LAEASFFLAGGTWPPVFGRPEPSVAPNVTLRRGPRARGRGNSRLSLSPRAKASPEPSVSQGAATVGRRRPYLPSHEPRLHTVELLDVLDHHERQAERTEEGTHADAADAFCSENSSLNVAQVRACPQLATLKNGL
jgi:hypothetical protein